jgi:hypothetical protein
MSAALADGRLMRTLSRRAVCSLQLLLEKHSISLSAIKILRSAPSSAAIDFRASTFFLGTHRFQNLHSIIQCCLRRNLVKHTETSRRSSGFPVPKSRFQPSTRALETAWRRLPDSASIQPFQRDFTCRRCGGAGCHRA